MALGTQKDAPHELGVALVSPNATGNRIMHGLAIECYVEPLTERTAGNVSAPPGGKGGGGRARKEGEGGAPKSNQHATSPEHR